MRKYNKIMKRYKKTIKRKYKGGILTPKKSTLKKIAPTTKRKNSDEYYGFKLHPLYTNQNSESSFGFSSSPRSAESYGFSSSSRKNTARCDQNDMECLKMERLKKIADNKETPTRKNPDSIEAHELFKKRRKMAKKDFHNFAAADAAEWKKAGVIPLTGDPQNQVNRYYSLNKRK